MFAPSPALSTNYSPSELPFCSVWLSDAGGGRWSWDVIITSQICLLWGSRVTLQTCHCVTAPPYVGDNLRNTKPENWKREMFGMVGSVLVVCQSQIGFSWTPCWRCFKKTTTYQSLIILVRESKLELLPHSKVCNFAIRTQVYRAIMEDNDFI